jgi:CubicO group peptidase (beta-lactamase class C family)
MRRTNLPAALLLLALIAYPARANEPLSDDRAQALDAFIAQFTELAMFDGFILVDIGGQHSFENSYGYAQAEYNIRHNQFTRFHLASVSKAITDAAVAKMLEQGVFSLNTTIAEFLPDFPSATDIPIFHPRPTSRSSIFLSTHPVFRIPTACPGATERSL